MLLLEKKLKVEKLGFIEIPADVVLHAAVGLKAEIICQREAKIDAMVKKIMARKKPSWLTLFLSSNKAEVETANNREDAIKIAKRMTRHLFDCPYWDATHHRIETYNTCSVLTNSANTVIKQVSEQGVMLIDLNTADLLAKYFP